MTDLPKPENAVPLEASIPDAAVPLESILCTEELYRRPSRPPDYEKENRALVALVQRAGRLAGHHSANAGRESPGGRASRFRRPESADERRKKVLLGSHCRRVAATQRRRHTRAISARAAMCSTVTFRCCSLTGSGVIHIYARRHRLPKRDCSSLFTSTAKRSARSGRSPTMIAANSTPRTCGCLKALGRFASAAYQALVNRRP